ncbi:MAG: hypothetical protein P4N24_11650 [Acidobacteriota bacterium]|nr:hypothetical protein [Acidobacteriota bacterium]
MADKIAKELVAPSTKQKCGVIMPISSIGDYPESHWADVYSIIREAVSDAGLEAGLVSYSDESSFIHKTIVQNLYDNPIVICDVSGKNPNVMFELGLRLAFDKPTIVIKDDATTYSFDTGPIEHLPYPRDLRFAKIVDFKAKLADKISATLKASKDPNYSTFLKHFGKFTVAKLEEKEVSSQEFVMDALKSIHEELAILRFDVSRSNADVRNFETIFITMPPDDSASIASARNAIRRLPGVRHVAVHQYDGNSRIAVQIDSDRLSRTVPLINEALRDIPNRISVERSNWLDKKFPSPSSPQGNGPVS